MGITPGRITRTFTPGVSLEEKQVEEQRQALLTDDDSCDSTSELSILLQEKRKTRWRRAALFWICLAVTTILIVSSVIVVAVKQHGNSVSHLHDSIVYQDDYTLSMDWDYLAAPQTREYQWILEEREFNPDGVYRPMLLINNQFPGPLIEVNEGDTVKVTIRNRMSNATSIHWHGIFQNGTNFMDGTVGVTQCPIAPGVTFTYEFTVTGQSGTYWYHAHHGAQASDGLAGPFIVHGKDERSLQQLDYASDRIVMVSDYYHRLTSGLVRQYLAPDMENTEPTPDGALINGRAIRDCDNIPASRQCDNSTKSRPVFQLEPKQRHRLRIINTGSFAEFQFQIDEHELAVTEADGTDLQPAIYHRLNIAPGQRYSVIVDANNTDRDTFRVRARMVNDCFKAINDYAVAEVSAVVTYRNGDSDILPDSRDWNERKDIECRDMNTTELVPVVVIPAPTTAPEDDIEDNFFYLRANFRIGDYRLARGFFNESTWKADVTSPTLFQFLEERRNQNHRQQPQGQQQQQHQQKPYVISKDSTSTSQTANQNQLTTPQQPLTLIAPGIHTLDLLIHNLDDGAHPLHLHGHKFFVLASGKGYPQPRTSLLDGVSRATLAPLYDSLQQLRNNSSSSALTNPLRRDTTTVEADGWILLRIVTDNPGVWALHCHVAWHAEAGMAMQLVSSVDVIDEKKIPAANWELCSTEPKQERELEKGATPKDEIYFKVGNGDGDDADADADERNGTGCEGESARGCGYGD